MLRFAFLLVLLIWSCDGRSRSTGGARTRSTSDASTIDGASLDGAPGFDASALDGGAPQDASLVDGGEDEFCGSPTLTVCDIKRSDSPRHPALQSIITLNNVVVSGPGPTLYDGTGGIDIVMFFIEDVQSTGDRRYRGMAVIYDPDQLVGTVPSTGDRITITGTYQEFGRTGAAAQQQLRASEIVINGSGPAPQPVPVTPAQVATSGPDAMAYEGILVRVSNVTVSNTNVSAVDGGQIYGAFEVDNTLIVSGAVYEHPAVTSELLTSVTGILRLGTAPYDAGLSLLAPRDANDVVSTHVRPTVTSIAAAMDPADPNHPAQICTENDPAGLCPLVDIQGLVVTAIGGYVSSTLRSMWVQDPLDSDGRFAGIKVIYREDQPPSVARGDRVDIIGELHRFYNSYQIEYPVVTLSSLGPATIVPAVVLPSSLSYIDPLTHTYEGSLVTITNVAVTERCFPGGDGRDLGYWMVAYDVLIGVAFPYSYNGDRIPSSVQCFDTGGTPTGLCACEAFPRPNDQRTLNASFISITGVMDYSWNNYTLHPRDDFDLLF